MSGRFLCVGGPLDGTMQEANYGAGGEFTFERRMHWPPNAYAPGSPEQDEVFSETHQYHLVCRGEACYLVYWKGKGRPLKGE